MAPGRTLLMAGEKAGSGERNALYRLDTETGRSFRVETGLEHISGWKLSASADGRTVAVTHSWFSAKLFVMPAGDSRRAVDLGPAFAEAPVFLPEHRLLFTGDDGHPWIVGADGSKRQRFSNEVVGHPAASLDGRVLVASKRDSGALTLWRVGSDGSLLAPLPDRRPAWHSDVTPDGRWIVYITGDGTLWKLATAGGQPVRLLDGMIAASRIGADGRSVALFRQRSGGTWQLAVVPLEGNGLLHSRDAPTGTAVFSGLHLAQNGTAVDLVRTEANVGNLWRVPLERGTPVQLTHFTSERIHAVDWSHDGRLLAVVRGGWRGDIMLLRGGAISRHATAGTGVPVPERPTR